MINKTNRKEVVFLSKKRTTFISEFTQVITKSLQKRLVAGSQICAHEIMNFHLSFSMIIQRIANLVGKIWWSHIISTERYSIPHHTR